MGPWGGGAQVAESFQGAGARVKWSPRARPAMEFYNFRRKMPDWDFMSSDLIFVIGSVFTWVTSQNCIKGSADRLVERPHTPSSSRALRGLPCANTSKENVLPPRPCVYKAAPCLSPSIINTARPCQPGSPPTFLMPFNRCVASQLTDTPLCSPPFIHRHLGGLLYFAITQKATERTTSYTHDSVQGR